MALAWCPLHAQRAVLHDLSTYCRRCALRSALPRPLRMPVSASHVSSSCSGALAAPPAVLGPLHICRARLHFADRLRAGAGRRSGSGWRQGQVRWGRPLLSRPRGAVGSGPAAVLAAVESAGFWPSRGRAGVSLSLDGCEVRLCDPCVRVCACVSRVCPGSPRCLLTGTVPLSRVSADGCGRLPLSSLVGTTTFQQRAYSGW